MSNLWSKFAPGSPGVSDKKSPAPGGLGALIPRPEVGVGAQGYPGAWAPGFETLLLYVIISSFDFFDDRAFMKIRNVPYVAKNPFIKASAARVSTTLRILI